jgi:hypothetical protein
MLKSSVLRTILLHRGYLSQPQAKLLKAARPKRLSGYTTFVTQSQVGTRWMVDSLLLTIIPANC